jgi:hypothetical protein
MLLRNESTALYYAEERAMAVIARPSAVRPEAVGRDGSAGPAALVAAGVLFALYPVVRPWGDATAAGSAAAFASPAWVVAHLAAVAGFVLLSLGLLSVRAAVAGGPGARAGGAAVVAAWLGTGLTLPYYGAETFALHALGRRVVDTGDDSLLGLADEIRMGAAQLTTFGIGLALLGAGAVLGAVAVWRSGALLRWSAIPVAVGMAVYLPQFFAPPSLRGAHGVLVGAGCLVLAAALRRARRR